MNCGLVAAAAAALAASAGSPAIVAGIIVAVVAIVFASSTASATTPTPTVAVVVIVAAAAVSVVVYVIVIAVVTAAAASVVVYVIVIAADVANTTVAVTSALYVPCFNFTFFLFQIRALLPHVLVDAPLPVHLPLLLPGGGRPPLRPLRPSAEIRLTPPVPCGAGVSGAGRRSPDGARHQGGLQDTPRRRRRLGGGQEGEFQQHLRAGLDGSSSVRACRRLPPPNGGSNCSRLV